MGQFKDSGKVNQREAGYSVNTTKYKPRLGQFSQLTNQYQAIHFSGDIYQIQLELKRRFYGAMKSKHSSTIHLTSQQLPVNGLICRGLIPSIGI